jgi:hypothetical protein
MNFYRCLDERRYEELAQLFVEDGVWVRMKKELVGPAAILAAMTEREGWKTAHVVSNIMVDVMDDSSAETSQYVTLYRHEGQRGEKGPAPMSPPRAILHHRDKMVRIGTEWKFQRKTSRPIMSSHAGG